MNNQTSYAHHPHLANAWIKKNTNNYHYKIRTPLHYKEAELFPKQSYIFSKEYGITSSCNQSSIQAIATQERVAQYSKHIDKHFSRCGSFTCSFASACNLVLI
jgi:hypothetical protein